MLDLISKLVPFLLVDALNPVLFALMVVAVGTNRPIANSTAPPAGHAAAYFRSGIVSYWQFISSCTRRHFFWCLHSLL